MPTEPIYYLIIGIVALVVAIIFFLIGGTVRKMKAEKEIGSAETEAKRILSDAIQNAEARKKEILMEAILSCCSESCDCSAVEAVVKSDDCIILHTLFLSSIFSCSLNGTFIRLCA